MKNFTVKTHRFEGQHIRHYPGATRQGDSDVLYLKAKEYIPLESQNPQPGDVTIIGAHATSFPKELYEPLWDDLLGHAVKNGFRIRSIWIADASNSGASGILNENVQGDDPSYSDYARDLLHMTNIFRAHMVAPIVGIGHSMGGTALVELSCMHPRLFASLVLIDPILGNDTLHTGNVLIRMASTKPDLWPSRDVAEKVFKKVFKNWDPRALDLWMKYGLQDTPTLLYPQAGQVTLRTTKAQEAWSYSKTMWDELTEDGRLSVTSRAKYPDATPATRPFYRAEADVGYEALPRVRPDVLYIFPEKSSIPATSQWTKLSRTGTATGGSGGVQEGRVAKTRVRAGHLCTFEDPEETAAAIATWLGDDLRKWVERTRYEREHRDDKSINSIRLSKEWIAQATSLVLNGRGSKSLL